MFDYDDYWEYNGDPMHDMIVDDFYVDDASEDENDDELDEDDEN